ncbi:MAG: glycosyltransferase 87 family protein [Chloroflexota bacterium]
MTCAAGQPRRPAPPRQFPAARAAAPYLVAGVLLVAGFFRYLPGTAYSQSPELYRAWAFPAFRYSDIIWLYLRDGLAAHPIPYLTYPLEYPPLTGLLSWFSSLAPGPAGAFTAAWLMNATAIMLAIWALGHVPGASPWPLAAAPALFFYPGHQFDPAAIGVAAAAIAACACGRPRLGAAGLAAAASMKLFPLAFLAALCADHLVHRRWRALAETCAIGAAVTVAANLPAALANHENWAFFYRWNRDRLADSGIWVLWRGAETSSLTTASLLLVAAGALAIAVWGMRQGGPLTATLGAVLLLWWLFANKTFTTHLMLWVLLAIALLRPPLWLWLSVVAVDVVGFQVGNYLNLYNVPAFQNPALIHSAVVHIYDPLQIARSGVLLACVAWGLAQLRRRRFDLPWPLSPPPRVPPPAPPSGVADLFAPVHAPERQRQRVIAATAAVAGFAAASVAMTWPLAKSPGTAPIPGFDPLLQAWLSRWVQHALANNPAGLYDANIFHPFPKTLAYTDANLPGALLAWPLDLIGGNPVLTSNLLGIASFVVAAGGVYAVVARLTGNRAAAWLAGFAYAFVPWRMVHLWHLNWLQSAGMPWVLLATLRVLERPTAARAAMLGFAGAIAALTSFYLSVQAALLAATLLAAALLAGRRARNLPTLRAFALAATVSVAIAGPFYLPYLSVRAEQGLQRTAAETQEYKAVPDSWLTLPPWDRPGPLQRALGVRAGENRALTTVGQARHADGHQHGEIVIEDAFYPGAWTLLAAAAGLLLWKRRWLAAGLAAVSGIAALLALGPTLGEGSGGPPLPYGWLFEHAPFFAAMRAPARLGGLAMLGIATLAGLGVAAGWNRIGPALERRSPALPAAAFALAAAVLAADLAAVPAPVEEVGFGPNERAAYTWLAGEPDGAVMEFPAESIFADPAGSSVRRHVGLAMLGSTLNWKPLVNGNSGFIPQSYSDLIERFVGNVPRPDGTLALRVSHVDRETASLLRQLGVRYLVVHTDRYRPGDLPAIEAALAGAAPLVTPAAEFGPIAIYRVAEAASPPARPAPALFAPTLLHEGEPWGPVLSIAGAGALPSLAALTRPTTLAAEWFDAEGRLIHRDGWAFEVPAVVDAPGLLCTPAGCDAGKAPADLRQLPRPAPGWRPAEPGHYVVRLSLSGDMPLSCTVDLDVRGPALPDPHERDLGLRWASCTPGNPYPVNDPGRPAFALSPPSVTLSGARIAVSADLAARERSEIRGWWILAPAGLHEPWREPAVTSPEVQRIVLPGGPATFSWIEELPPGLPDGVYGLSLWFHRNSEDGWRHAIGGGFGVGPIVIENGAARWAGPLRIGSPPRTEAMPGQRVSLRLSVAGRRVGQPCAVSWRVLSPGGGAVSEGWTPGCDAIEPFVPATAAPGAYRIDIRVFSGERGTSRLEDGVVAPFVVLETGAAGWPQ